MSLEPAAKRRIAKMNAAQRKFFDYYTRKSLEQLCLVQLITEIEEVPAPEDILTWMVYLYAEDKAWMSRKRGGWKVLSTGFNTSASLLKKGG